MGAPARRHHYLPPFTTIVPILLLLCATSLFAQAQLVTLTFTGRDANNRYLPLTRVIVSNLTKGWQETLLWPDTVLVMSGTGIGDFETFQETSLRLSQNNPNPFDGTTFVNLEVAEPGDVAVEITDIAGRIVGGCVKSDAPSFFAKKRVCQKSKKRYFLTHNYLIIKYRFFVKVTFDTPSRRENPSWSYSFCLWHGRAEATPIPLLFQKGWP